MEQLQKDLLPKVLIQLFVHLASVVNHGLVQDKKLFDSCLVPLGRFTQHIAKFHIGHLFPPNWSRRFLMALDFRTYT